MLDTPPPGTPLAFTRHPPPKRHHRSAKEPLWSHPLAVAARIIRLECHFTSTAPAALAEERRECNAAEDLPARTFARSELANGLLPQEPSRWSSPARSAGSHSAARPWLPAIPRLCVMQPRTSPPALSRLRIPRVLHRLESPAPRSSTLPCLPVCLLPRPSPGGE